MGIDIALLVAALSFALAFIVHLFDRRKVRMECTYGFMMKYTEIQQNFRNPGPGVTRWRAGDIYNRQMIDLMWAEFESYRLGLLPESILVQWLRNRYEMYHGIIRHIHGARPYKDTWDDTQRSGYFGPGSDYIELMQNVHDLGCSEDIIRGLLHPYRPRQWFDVL